MNVWVTTIVLVMIFANPCGVPADKIAANRSEINAFTKADKSVDQNHVSVHAWQYY